MKEGIYTKVDYGRVVITLKNLLDDGGVTRNKLATLTGSGNNLVKRYYCYEDTPISSVDLGVLAKMCYVLECDVADLLKYERPIEAEGVIPMPDLPKQVAENKKARKYDRQPQK